MAENVDGNVSSVTVNMDGNGGAEQPTPQRETLLDGGASPEDAPSAGNGTEGAGGDTVQTAADTVQYDAFILPQGMDPEDEQVAEALDEAQGLFREMGLNQQQAQRLIDLHMKHYIGALAEDQERFERELNRKVAAWGMDVKRDPDYGGARLNESLTSIKRAIAHLGGEPLMYALNQETGLINHPEVFKAFARMGRYFSEDKLVMGANGKGIDDSPSGMAARVYPNMNARR